MAPTQTPEELLVEELAAELGADPRTIIRRMAGLPVKGAAGVAIDRALAARGHVMSSSGSAPKVKA